MKSILRVSKLQLTILGMWGVTFVLSLFAPSPLQAQSPPGQAPAVDKSPAVAKEGAKWTALPFEAAKSGKGWQQSDFGGDGPVQWKNQLVELGMGQPMTGIHWTGEFPRDKFEVRFEGRRVEGDDFFVGLTFPVAKEHCSIILGGWSGAISGLSNINGYDASENESTFYKEYKNNQWYKVRLLVTPEKIQAWVDDEQVVDQDREDVRFGVRIEVDPSLPLGFSCYRCKAEIRNFEYRNATEG